MALLFIYLAIALFFSFLCSMLEASLLSIPPTYVRFELSKGTKKGKLLEKYKHNIDLPLAAILTLNTFAHTIGASGVGAQAQQVWGNAYVTATSIVLTLLILVLSEIIPKTIGAIYWKPLTGFTARTLTILIYSPLYPFIILSQLVTRIFKRGNNNTSVLSRDEFRALTEIGINEGIFMEEESSVLRNFMKFNTIQTKSIMTPRVVVKAADENELIEDFYEENKNLRFSRIPVFDKNIDQISGFILKDDLLQSIIEEKGHQKLKSLKRDIPFVHEQLQLVKLFSKLITSRVQIAAVVGEYGEFLGVVSMEDIIETLIGLEIMDEMDRVEDLQKLARKNWEQRARRLGLI